MRTAKSAPLNTPILVWVRGAGMKGEGQWCPGRVARGDGLPDELKSDFHNGDWDIPFWSPYPDNPE